MTSPANPLFSEGTGKEWGKEGKCFCPEELQKT